MNKTKLIKIGNVSIGAGNAVAVQSMTNTKTYDVKSTLAQIKRLEAVGCEIIRVSVPDDESAKALDEIKSNINIPLIADIHFKPSLALKAIKNGVDKIRINPGTIRSEDKLKEIIHAAGEKGIPIRIGANSGSLPPELEELKHINLAKALVESTLRTIEIFEKENFYNLVLSCKASDVIQTINAYTELSKNVDYPLHLGITEAGTLISGNIKSAVGLGVLLFNGIGDTMRVSLTDDPVEEVRSAYKILSALNIRKRGIDVISCPSCARCDVDVISLAKEVEKSFEDIETNLKVAVMGCPVNGPGEAKEADIGVAAGKGNGILFKKGKIIGKFKENELHDKLMEEVRKLTVENKKNS